MMQMSLEGTEYDLEKQIKLILLLEIDYDLEKMDNTSHLHLYNTILIHLSDSSFINVSVLSG